jgi:hypothetical protein
LGKLGSFFGIITFVFGFFILFGSPIVGVIVMVIGVGIIYGSSRPGGTSRSEDIKGYDARYDGANPNNPASPYHHMK